MFHRPVYFYLIAACLLGFSLNAYSEVLESLVSDDAGKPVADAVVYARAISGDHESDASKTGIIDQVDKEFVSYVTSIMVGTAISFPNNDKIRHHVYSRSPAKRFELPLYPPGKGPEKPVLFDTPGIVVLGCNIHDWMKAYVYVLETPFFAKTDAHGKAKILDLPPGEYEVLVWHPRIKKSAQAISQRITLAAGSSEGAVFTIALKREWRPMRAPKLSGGLYR